MAGRKVKIKICGMRDADNLRAIAALRPDYFGMIFYAKSPRYVEPAVASALPEFAGIKRVGVFVNELIEKISDVVIQTKLSALQLHGIEPPETCAELKDKFPELEIIKVFSVGHDFNDKSLKKYESVCDNFLFDTRTDKHGGSGEIFDWNILRSFPINRPFFLSGGVSPENFREAIAACQGLPLHAIDLNSRVEIAPGLKSAELIEEIIKSL